MTKFYLIGIAVLGLVIITFSIIAYYNHPRQKGKRGEKAVDSLLLSDTYEKKYTVSDLLFLSENKTVQIDHILINKQGIFVIETKNYGGRIYGNDGQLEWTQVFGKKKIKFYNPVKQNATHIYHLNKILPKKVPIHSVVVFAKNNTAYVTSNNVVGISSLTEYLAKYRATVLSNDEIDDMYDFFIDLKANTDVSALEHYESVDSVRKNIGSNICPRCNGNLILKSGRYGEFYGCVNYPDCTFTKKFDI